MHIEATFLKIERKTGEFEGKPYDFTLMHLLDDTTVRKVRLPKGHHDVPFQRGDLVSLDVDAAENVKITTDEDSLRAAISEAIRAA